MFIYSVVGLLFLAIKLAVIGILLSENINNVYF